MCVVTPTWSQELSDFLIKLLRIANVMLYNDMMLSKKCLFNFDVLIFKREDELLCVLHREIE